MARRLVRQARHAGGIGAAAAGDQALDRAVALAGNLPDQSRQRVLRYAERGKPVRGRLYAALAVDKGEEFPFIGEPAEGEACDFAGIRRCSRRREQDRVFPVGHGDRARRHRNRLAGHAGDKSQRDGAVDADRGKAARRRQLAARHRRQDAAGADECFDVGLAEQRRSRPVRPQRPLQVRGQDDQGVACGKAPSHRVQHGDIEKRIA